MLLFKVFDDGGAAAGFAPTHAHLLGRDDVGQRGEIVFRDGLLRCRKRNDDPAALCLMVDAGAMGRLLLQTCLLPDRDEPYLLSLELARHRIKAFIARSEEWQMWDLDPGHPAIRMWNEARERFTDAINDPDEASADRHARASLIAAIEASERLALAHAEVLLHRRFGTRAASSTTLGLGVAPGRMDAVLQGLLAREADVVCVPLRWRDLEVAEGRYDWDRIDRWMAWAHEQRKPIVAGPLMEFTPRALPPWIEVWKHDFETCRDLVYDHLAKVVERYRGVVGIWNLAAGLNVNDHFCFSPEQMTALLRTASVLVRQMRRGARTMLEVVQPFGEHVAFNRDSLSPTAWLDAVVQEGLQLDCLGVRVRFGRPGDGMMTRDLFQVSAMLDRLLPYELPVMLTDVGVPAAKAHPDAGWWRGPWSAAVQADWIGRLFPIAMSKPFVEAIMWGDLADHPGQDMAGAGLVTQENMARPALARLVTARRRLRKPLGVLKAAARATVLGEME